MQFWGVSWGWGAYVSQVPVCIVFLIGTILRGVR